MKIIRRISSRSSVIAVVSILLMLNLSSAQDKKTLAVLDFEGLGVTEIETKALTNRLRGNLVNSQTFQIIERGKMNEILDEQGFQLSGCTSDACMVEAGQLLGVELMLAGSISLVGSTYSVEMRLINIGTGEIQKSASYDMRGQIDDLLTKGMEKAANILQGIEDASTPEPTPQPQVTTQQVAPTRKLGFLSVYGSPEKAKLILNNKKIGRIPLENYQYDAGSWTLIAKKAEYKTFTQTVVINDQENTSVAIEMTKMAKFPRLILSAVVPGLGQMTQKRVFRGFLFAAASAGVGYLALDQQGNCADYKADYQNKLDIYNQNTSNPALWSQQKEDIQTALDVWNDGISTRNLYLASLGGIWSINILDILF